MSVRSGSERRREPADARLRLAHHVLHVGPRDVGLAVRAVRVVLDVHRVLEQLGQVVLQQVGPGAHSLAAQRAAEQLQVDFLALVKRVIPFKVIQHCNCLITSPVELADDILR
jgi:hypothetical protein